MLRQGDGYKAGNQLGRVLFAHADRILNLYGEAEAELADLTGELRGRLRVSATSSAGLLAAIDIDGFKLVRDFFVARPVNRSVHRRVDRFAESVKRAASGFPAA